VRSYSACSATLPGLHAPAASACGTAGAISVNAHENSKETIDELLRNLRSCEDAETMKSVLKLVRRNAGRNT